MTGNSIKRLQIVVVCIKDVQFGSNIYKLTLALQKQSDQQFSKRTLQPK